MKTILLAALFAFAGLAQAQQSDTMRPMQRDAAEPAMEADTSAPAAPPRFQTRGIVPIVGMPCVSGYKHVGDDCIMANIEFE
ncbi:hypothetical protein CCOS865_01147 [Pseudomonas reidholzensis]|uniref:Secreted protein n=1 Tax=Pseudomonas reidholzensis TaxID=1785162 RepID=A0A383RPB4_9PSED|nr:hypothetical protein [Pseudomonas reidholzensis]SYX88907.1 hypothetical protein CCOS865_01147 [Pseudomonas reidholzensis]